MLLASVLFVAALQEPAPPVKARLQVGESVAGVLSAASPQRFELELGEPQALTITLESFDFDAVLRVEGRDGSPLAQDDDSGLSTDARLELDAPAACLIVVSAKTGSGEFTLTVHAGRLPPLSKTELMEAGIAWCAKAAERALARGDLRAAADHRLQEGTRWHELRRFPEARAAFERALDHARTASDRTREAAALGNLGAACFESQEYALARDCYEQGLDLARELGDRAGEVKLHGNLGRLCMARRDAEGAREHFGLALELARSLGDRATEAKMLGELGELHSALGDIARAKEMHEQAVAIFRELGDRKGLASALGSLGNACWFLGDFAGAREHYESRLELARELGDRHGEAQALGNLGNIYFALGDYSRAREHYERDLDIAREIGDRSGTAMVVLNLGNLSYSLGDFAGAREHYEQALALARELGDRTTEAGVLANLGGVYDTLGDHARSRENNERSLELFRELGDRRGEGMALSNMGDDHLGRGELERARECYEQSIEIARATGDRYGEAMTLGHLGAVENARGDFARALEYHEQRLELARELGDRPGEAAALVNLGVVCKSQGAHERSRELATSAAALGAELGYREVRLHALLILAGDELALGNALAAQAALDEAEGLMQELTSFGLEALEAGGLRGRYAGLGAVAQDIAALRLEEAGTDAVERAAVLRWGFAAAGRWKGRALLEGIAEHRAGARSAEALELRRSRREALATHGATLQRLSQAIQDARPSAEIAALRDEARTRLEEAERLAVRLEQVSPRDARLDMPLGASPEEVQATVLSARDLLIEFVEGEERLYAYVLGKEALAMQELGKRADIALQVEAFLAGLRDPRSLAPPATLAATGHALFERLLAPALSGAGTGVERLVIVPSPGLAGLPFEALVVACASAAPSGFAEITFVLDRFELTYGPSAPVLIELAGTPPRQAQGRVLVLADPRYPAEPSGAGDATAQLVAARPLALPEPAELARLPGSREEAFAIARALIGETRELSDLYPLRSGSLAEDRLELHLGESANRARLSGDLRGCSSLHIACHGFVDAEHPQRTGIALSPRPDDDGYFTILDALDLDLDCDLVVLSACETARGAERSGEGVESLARAFLYAGARGFVASLWSVDDRAAARTMAAFYEGWLGEGRAPARALHAAKLALRRGTLAAGPARGIGGTASASAAAPESGHPYFWAPFIHVGIHVGLGR